MRSLLFVPGDSEEKLAKALRVGADALILDLEDSVATSAKDAARRTTLAFLREHRGDAARPRFYVRINALSTAFCEGDVDVIMTGAPDGVVLPKAKAGADVVILDARLAVREALHGLADGCTDIIPIATESADALFSLGTYHGSSTRLSGLAWGAEDLSADTGAHVVRTAEGWTEPNRLVRNLALFGAAAAGVPAIDTVFTDFRDLEGLRIECDAAVRDGFSGKLAIHPDQVEVINEAFSPSAEAIEHAEKVVAAFANSNGAGVVALDGKMLDRPHLKSAERLLAHAGRDRSTASDATRPPSIPS